VKLPRFRIRILAAIVVLLLAGGGAWLWLRDSSLVAVNGVTVTGVSGPNAARIDAALEAAARGMSTLHVDAAKLRAAVAEFPSVKDIKVSTAFPHGMRIRVTEQQAVATLLSGGQRVAVAGDGTVLRDASARSGLPTLPVGALPSGSRISDQRTLAILGVLGAAPYQLLNHVQGVADNATHGVVVQLRDGPNLYFGDPGLDGAKWTAASAVLADPGSIGAGYIDVTDPRRPAAGAG
jgi:cell division protein FtsQ